MRCSHWLPGVSLLLLTAASVHADPRWWWNDVRVTNNPGNSVTPHVMVPGYYSMGLPGSIFIAWADDSVSAGVAQVYVTEQCAGLSILTSKRLPSTC